MSGFDWSTFDNSRKNTGVSKTWDHQFGNVNPWFKDDLSINSKWPTNTESTDKFLNDFNKKWDQYRVEQTSRFQTYYTTGQILLISAFGVGIVIVLILLVFGARCRKNRTQTGTVLSTGRVLGQGAVQQNQQIPMRSPGQGGAVPPNIGMPYSNRTLNEVPPSYPREPMVYNNGMRNESGKDSFNYVNESSFHK